MRDPLPRAFFFFSNKKDKGEPGGGCEVDKVGCWSLTCHVIYYIPRLLRTEYTEYLAL